MLRARWWVLAVLGLLTVTVVVLDVTGVIFESEPTVLPPDPLQFDEPAVVDAALAPVDVFAEGGLPPGTERALAKILGDQDLGPRVLATVMSPSGRVLYGQDSGQSAAPASTLKLLTALSVLDAFPTSTRIETRVVEGESPNELVLVGGGDATLTVGRARGNALPTASLSELARATSNAVGDSSVRLAYDDSLFTGPAVSSAWEPTYVSSGVIAPVTALMADQGLVSAQGLARYPDPAAAAAADFAQLLEEEGVAVKGAPKPATAKTSAARVAVVSSPPIGLLVERMLRDSDNQLAEALGRLAAVERDLPGSFTGAVDAIGVAADGYDITVDTDNVYDASGLSRQDLVTATALAGVLGAAVTEPDLRPITTGLPVAGFDGTLFDRYLTLPQSKAAGFVRAKTGTLTGVSAEAGLVITCDGELVQFAFLADRVPFDTDAARNALDEAAAALALCR